MAKSSEYPTGYAMSLSYTEPEMGEFRKLPEFDKLIAQLNHERDMLHPDPWMYQDPIRTVYDSENEASYHYELDDRTSAGRIFEAYQNSRMDITGSEHLSTAIQVTQVLGKDAENTLHLVDVKAREQEDMIHSPTSYIQAQIAHRFEEWQSNTQIALVLNEPDDFAHQITVLQQIQRDANRLLQDNRPLTIQEEEGRPIDKIYDLAGNLSGNYNRNQRETAVTELVESATQLPMERISKHAESVYINGRPEEFELATTMEFYTYQMKEHAKLAMIQGTMDRDYILYGHGAQIATALREQIEEFIENGTVPTMDERSRRSAPELAKNTLEAASRLSGQ